MKKLILIISAALISASPALAQSSLFRPSTSKSNPTMVRTPPSSLPGAGLSSYSSSPTSSYPKPAKSYYDPTFRDPTQRNSSLRKK
jgi:hypothetical protein